VERADLDTIEHDRARLRHPCFKAPTRLLAQPGDAGAIAMPLSTRQGSRANMAAAVDGPTGSD